MAKDYDYAQLIDDFEFFSLFFSMFVDYGFLNLILAKISAPLNL